METTLLAILENSFQATVLQDVLNDENIETFTRNGAISSIFPNSPGFQIEIWVFEKEYEKALEIYEKSFPELAKGES